MNSLMHRVHLLANQTVQKNENKIISGLKGQFPSSMASFPVTNAMNHMVPTEHKIEFHPYKNIPLGLGKKMGRNNSGEREEEKQGLRN